MINRLIDWCLTLTLAIFQLYRGVQISNLLFVPVRMKYNKKNNIEMQIEHTKDLDIEIKRKRYI